MILADENIDKDVVGAIRKIGIDVLHVKDKHIGIADADVVELSKTPPRIILTEDKDFGEWVYAHQETGISVILIRYFYSQKKEIISVLCELLELKGKELFGKFTTITVEKIRIRSIK